MSASVVVLKPDVLAHAIGDQRLVSANHTRVTRSVRLTVQRDLCFQVTAPDAVSIVG